MEKEEVLEEETVVDLGVDLEVVLEAAMVGD